MPTDRASERADTIQSSASTRTSRSQLVKGGMVISPDAEGKQNIDSARNQGRAPDMGWLDHNTSASTIG